MVLALTEQVRATCKAAAERAYSVQINHDLIPAYAASLPLAEIALPEIDPSCHYLGHGGDTVAFLLALDAINFGSGYFPHLRKRPGMSGYFTVASLLNNYYRKQGPPSARELTQITTDDCTRIFSQDRYNAPIQELMQHFTTALNDLGHYLLEGFDGSFVGLVEAANTSAERLVQLLIAMPYFNDVEPYADLTVAFYKRAQLTASDLALAFHGQGPGRFHDLEKLTIFADNLVPHVLRVDGILSYRDTLAAQIDAEKLITAGSAQEVEIRACAVHAVELLVKELRRAGHRVNAVELDYFLWNRGQQPVYKACPRHRARTVFY